MGADGEGSLFLFFTGFSKSQFSLACPRKQIYM
jgi:hypothetical protein